jgi:exopolyphosphatase/guanosine-5'-triphosphate,3'-diphosphate pyrophosphatase
MVISSIDIGSNTVLLLVAEVDLSTKNIIRLREEQRLPRISRGLIPGGRITDESIKILFSVLKEYFEIIRSYNCDTVLLSGTNAFRIASNTSQIKSGIEAEFNIGLKVLTGEEEAEMAYVGIDEYGNKNESKLVIDIGGGSTELIYGKDKISFIHSFNAGVVSLSEKYLLNYKPSNSELNAINKDLREIFSVLPSGLSTPDNAIALAGTPVTLVCIKEGLNEDSIEETEGSILNLVDVQFLYEHLAEMVPDEILKTYKGIVKGREDLILTGSIILLFLMNLLRIEKVIVSNKGIRYGAIKKYLETINYK